MNKGISVFNEIGLSAKWPIRVSQIGVFQTVLRETFQKLPGAMGRVQAVPLIPLYFTY